LYDKIHSALADSRRIN